MHDPTTPPDPAQPVVMARPVDEAAMPYAAEDVGPTSLKPLDMSYLSRRDALLDGGLVLIIAIVVQYVPSLILSLWTTSGPLPAVDWVTVAAKWFELLMVVSFCAYFVIRNGVKLRSYGLHRERVGIQLLWTPLILVCAYAVMLIVGVVTMLVWGTPTQVEHELSQRTEFAGAMPIDNIRLALPLMFAVAIHEELLFRGLLLPYLKRATGSWIAAIAVSSVVFGSLHFHQGGIAVVQITALAVVLSTMFIASRSLIAVIVAHFIFDMVQLQLMRWLPEALKWAEHAASQPS